MIDIAMLSFNRARITHLSITEIVCRTTSPFRLIVYDNGSKDDSVEMLHHWLKKGFLHLLLLSDENRGVHFGFNWLLEHIQSEPYYICTDNDLLPCAPLEGRDWLSRLVQLAEAHSDFGAISCRPHIFVGGIPNWDESKELIEVPWAGAALRLMRTCEVRQAGGWDKVIRPSRDNEERWISDRLHRRGLKVGYARDIRCFHIFGERGKTDPWGYPPDWKPEKHGHREISPPVYIYGDRSKYDPQTWEPLS